MHRGDLTSQNMGTQEAIFPFRLWQVIVFYAQPERNKLKK